MRGFICIWKKWWVNIDFLAALSQASTQVLYASEGVHLPTYRHMFAYIE